MNAPIRLFPPLPTFDWVKAGFPDPRIAARRNRTTRARLSSEATLGCIADALSEDEATRRASCALGWYEGDTYTPWADPADVVAALELSREQS